MKRILISFLLYLFIKLLAYNQSKKDDMRPLQKAL